MQQIAAWVFASVNERSVVTKNIIVALTYDYIDRLDAVSSADSDYAVRFDLRN